MSLSDQLLFLTKRLYPTGRAFRIPRNSTIESIHKGLNLSEERAYEFGTSNILDQLLPDNDNFDEAAASDWERRLAVPANPLTDLELRKAAIRRKYAAPLGRNPARGHQLTVQTELQTAGFDVYIHENPNGLSPIEVNPAIANQHGEPNQHGPDNQSSGTLERIINSIDPAVDNAFVLPSDLRSTFFISGMNIGEFAEIPLSRQTEFRQLVLTLKQAHLIGFLFVNYDDSDFNLDFNLDYLS